MIHALWEGEDKNLLIMPSAVPMENGIVLSAEDEEILFEESLLVRVIGGTQYSEVQVFAPDSSVSSAEVKMRELGIPTASQLSETEWTPGATYETRY